MQPGPNDQPTIQSAQPYPAQPMQTPPQPAPLPQAQPNQPRYEGPVRRGGGKVARRALLAAGTLGACAGAVAIAPIAEQRLQQYAEDQAKQAFQNGITAGRQALLAELTQLETWSLDDAIQIAEWTRLAVNYIVAPLAKLTATIAGDALQAIASSLAQAHSNLASINVHLALVDQLYTLVTEWHDGVTSLPIALNDYANKDITGAEAYLKSLKRKIQQEATPTATTKR